jgi:hypothetical protein
VRAALDRSVALSLQAVDIVLVETGDADCWSCLEIMKFGRVFLSQEINVHVCVWVATDSVHN